MLPSSNEYYDFEKKEFVKLDTPRLVGNTTGGSWHGVVSNFSANPEATYSFLSLMAIQPVSKLMATVGWDGVDPGFSYQFLEEDGGTAKIEDYVEAGWAENDAKTYTHAYHEIFYAPTMLPYLRIPGTFEYWDILDKNLSAAMSGAKTAQQALDDTAAAWEQVTDRIGRDKQLEDYQAAIGYAAVSRTAAIRPGRLGAPGRFPEREHPMRWTSRVRFLFLAPGGDLGAGLHRLSARLFALSRLLQDRAEGRGEARQGADARCRRASPCSTPGGSRAPRTSCIKKQVNIATFIGLDNFKRLFSDPQVRRGGPRHRALRAGRRADASWCSGFLLALLFNQHIFGRPVLRAVMILPIFATPLAVGYTFFTIFYEDGGPLGWTGIPFLSNPHWALFSVILVDVWQWTPFCFLVFLAALQGVPDELYEAARVDGAGAWRHARREVMLPVLQPTIIIVLLLRMAEALKLFDIPFALTGGGPGVATQSFSLLAFRTGLRFFDLGYASAMAYGAARRRDDHHHAVLPAPEGELWLSRAAPARATRSVDAHRLAARDLRRAALRLPDLLGVLAVAAQPDRHLHRRRLRHSLDQLHADARQLDRPAQHAGNACRRSTTAPSSRSRPPLLALALGTPAAYAIARFRFERWKNRDITVWFLSQRVLPPVATVIPFYLTMR